MTWGTLLALLGAVLAGAGLWWSWRLIYRRHRYDDVDHIAAQVLIVVGVMLFAIGLGTAAGGGPR